jgi:hypothetical protein
MHNPASYLTFSYSMHTLKGAKLTNSFLVKLQFSNFFYYTQTLIDIWIIFLTQYLQRKISDLVARNAPSIKGFRI